MDKEQNRRSAEMSEAYLTALFLTLSGGFQDAYTYCFRGRVFANAQTGNIVLLSAHLLRGNWWDALHYLIPISAFVAGTCFAEMIHSRFRRVRKLYWQQIILLIEILLLFAVGFIPVDNFANALVSFVCAMQVQTFRRMQGNAYASTMCIGNLRSGTEMVCAYFRTRDKALLRGALQYAGIIFVFAAGAGFGSVAALLWGAAAIWFSCAFLIVCFCLMFRSGADQGHINRRLER